MGGHTRRPRFVYRMAIDLTPLRESQPFRRLCIGQGVSAVGSAITFVAVPFQVYELTGSTLLVGLLGGVTVVPMLTVPLLGGAIADIVDRRRLLLWTEFAPMLVSLALVTNALQPKPHVSILFAAVIVTTIAYGLQRPARSAITPRLVSAKQLTAALAAEHTAFNVARVGGPALARVLIASIGFAGTYAIDALSFGASLVAIWLLPSIPGAGIDTGGAGRALGPSAMDSAMYEPTRRS